MACPECIENGEWKNSLRTKYCKVCGYNRTITFSQKPFRQTKVDRKWYTKDPLYDFLYWLLYDISNRGPYETVAFAHNGGRFDTVLAFRTIFQMKINPDMITKVCYCTCLLTPSA